MYCTVKMIGLFIAEKIYKRNVIIVNFEDSDFTELLNLVPK